MLQAGERAAEFAFPDADMEMVALGDFRGKHCVILYFYPKR